MRRHNANIEAISLVARELSKLSTKVVFTGGAIVGLLLTDSAAPDVRPTDDVDVIVAITRYSDFVSLQGELRKLGFEHDIDGPNCRFILHGLKVDVMPTEGAVLGFTNTWYDFALNSAIDHPLPDGTSIRVISAPAFIATKLEAFEDRGQGDFLMSHDLEDIIAVVDGREELAEEIRATDVAVRTYICDAFASFIANRTFLDSIAAHLLPDEASQSRFDLIIDRMRTISKFGSKK